MDQSLQTIHTKHTISITEHNLVTYSPAHGAVIELYMAELNV